jgi:cysteinyl-tRNA synthetase
MDFYINNTETRTKEKFIPLKEGFVGLYTCGPTVYDYAHIGNLRTYIFEDILKKSLEYNDYKVKHVMNVTDVGHLQSDSDAGEDKMALGAKRENKSAWDIARFYENAFFEDLQLLNIKRADVECRATEHINEMIELVKSLEDKGYTYNANGNVYYSIDKFEDYKKFANIRIDEFESVNRVEVDLNKKNPLDFVLWFTNSKFTNHIMEWDSPWGKGFPGWHAECSAMAIKYLGERLDIHCGGVDHIPVHHTNEIAQSEGVLGHKWVNYWVHGEFLIDQRGKMSKSSGEFLTLAKLKQDGFSPLGYRYFCLQSRYRKQLVFSYETLTDVQMAFIKLKKKIGSIIKNVNENDMLNIEKIDIYKNKFNVQINDDLNTPNAFSVLFEVIKDDNLNPREKITLIKDFDKVFSLDLLKIE